MIEINKPKQQLIIAMVSATMLCCSALVLVKLTEHKRTPKPPTIHKTSNLQMRYGSKILELEKDGDLASALKISDEYVAKFPDHPSAYKTRAFIRTQLGKKDAAKKDFEKAFSIDSKQKHQSLISKAYSNFDLGNYDKAMEILRTAISTPSSSKFPEKSACRCLRARILNKQGRHEDAIKECNLVLKSSPHYPYIRHYRGEARLKLNRLESAVSDLTIELNNCMYANSRSDQAEILRLRSIAYAKLSKDHLSEIDYKKYEELKDYTKNRRDGYIGIMIGAPGNIVGKIGKNSPAEASELQTGDEIISVDGISFGALGRSKLIYALRGPVGTNVTIKIERLGKLKTFTLKRAAVTHTVDAVIFNRM